MVRYKCSCKKPKVIEVEFSVKALDENDTWLLCFDCEKKLVFKKHRINTKTLEVHKNE